MVLDHCPTAPLAHTSGESRGCVGETVEALMTALMNSTREPPLTTNSPASPGPSSPFGCIYLSPNPPVLGVNHCLSPKGRADSWEMHGDGQPCECLKAQAPLIRAALASITFSKRQTSRQEDLGTITQGLFK